jgi:hypothetical protein
MNLKTIAFCLLLPAPALAQGLREEAVSLSKPQARELLGTLQDEAANPIDQIFAFDTLICSDQAAIRDMSLRAGAVSKNPSIQSEIIFLALARKSILTVELDEVEGLTKQHYDFLASNRINNSNITHVDRANACLSLGQSGKCEENQRIYVSGRNVAISGHWKIGNKRTSFEGTFNYDGGENLRGEIELLLGSATLRFPASISLF